MKLRFAPSPTGFLHVGGARTAIFNLLHARRYGGTMLLRIEDTDVERSRQHHAEQIVSSLQWLGVEWDEGPIYQSDRLDRYRERAEELVASGQGVSLLLHRRRARRRTRGGRDARASSGATPDAAARIDAAMQPDEPHVIRFEVPPGTIEFHDLIRGDVHFEGELIDDFVLLRSDGNPTYHLSVVVDDIDMAITHVARGDDHLSNTPKHILLFRAFGAEVPVVRASAADPRQRQEAPLASAPARRRAEEYRDMGIVPRGALQLPDAPRLVARRATARSSRATKRRRCSISRDVNKAPAVFDPEKLLWMNGQYLMRMTADEIYPHLVPFLGDDPRPLDELRTSSSCTRCARARCASSPSRCPSTSSPTTRSSTTPRR